MSENDMDFLDLDDGETIDGLPEAPVFTAPRPRKPWLLLGLGLVIILLATYVLVRTIGGDSSSSVDIDLDAPAIVIDGDTDADVNPMPRDGDAAPIMPSVPAGAAVGVLPPPPAPVAHNDDNVTPGMPVRVIEDRKDVVFKPDAASAEPAPIVKPMEPKPAAKPAAKPAPKPAAKPAPKPAPKKQAVAAQNGSWYVQFGSYSTRAAAESAERTIRNGHASLFQGRQFVILAAQMADGTTKYRLRIAFATAADANGFCRNAKSDGVDCYVAK